MATGHVLSESDRILNFKPQVFGREFARLCFNLCLFFEDDSCRKVKSDNFSIFLSDYYGTVNQNNYASGEQAQAIVTVVYFYTKVVFRFCPSFVEFYLAVWKTDMALKSNHNVMLGQ